MNDVAPRHIGYIIDGNRRWAKSHGLPTYEGHLAGYNAIKDVALATLEAGVKYMSAYVFSTENWKRSEDEVNRLMSLIMKLFSSDIHFFTDNDVKLVVLGTREGLDDKIVAAIEEAEALTADGSSGTFALCFNYGGHLEIAEACKKIVQSGIRPEDITPDVVAENLYSPELPPCDLIVRTSGEQRLSNFMLWRAAYSELIFLKKNWPEMTKEDVSDIIKEYQQRHRRFGG
ncbi:di-trans,poly-cis-decaprenylcistransferase [Candidatus Saccharibacteria bacterium 32-49-12]|nr:MAG: di-trans,poly-cis-decaprenylcistransferase [Candidatus Saccharibacteria bacterium 32-49-12]